MSVLEGLDLQKYFSMLIYASLIASSGQYMNLNLGTLLSFYDRSKYEIISIEQEDKTFDWSFNLTNFESSIELTAKYISGINTYTYKVIFKENEVCILGTISSVDHPERAESTSMLHIRKNQLLSYSYVEPVSERERLLTPTEQDILINTITPFIFKVRAIISQKIQNSINELKGKVSVFRQEDLIKLDNPQYTLSTLNLINQLHRNGLMTIENYKIVIGYQDFSNEFLKHFSNISIIKQDDFNETSNKIIQHLKRLRDEVSQPLANFFKQRSTGELKIIDEVLKFLHPGVARP